MSIVGPRKRTLVLVIFSSLGARAAIDNVIGTFGGSYGVSANGL